MQTHMNLRSITLSLAGALSLAACKQAPTAAVTPASSSPATPAGIPLGQVSLDPDNAFLGRNGAAPPPAAAAAAQNQTTSVSLTRENALRMIKLEPVYESMDLATLHEQHDAYHGPFDFVILEAEKEGLLLTRDIRPDEPKYAGVAKNVNITQKGMAYLVKKDRKDYYHLADRKPIEITGIGAPSPFSGKTVSKVNFKFANVPTPFGVAFDRAQKANYCSGLGMGVATFVLYDDGWHFEGWEMGR